MIKLVSYSSSSSDASTEQQPSNNTATTNAATPAASITAPATNTTTPHPPLISCGQEEAQSSRKRSASTAFVDEDSDEGIDSENEFFEYESRPPTRPTSWVRDRVLFAAHPRHVAQELDQVRIDPSFAAAIGIAPTQSRSPARPLPQLRLRLQPPPQLRRPRIERRIFARDDEDDDDVFSRRRVPLTRHTSRFSPPRSLGAAAEQGCRSGGMSPPTIEEATLLGYFAENAAARAPVPDASSPKAVATHIEGVLPGNAATSPVGTTTEHPESATSQPHPLSASSIVHNTLDSPNTPTRKSITDALLLRWPAHLTLPLWPLKNQNSHREWTRLNERRNLVRRRAGLPRVKGTDMFSGLLHSSDHPDLNEEARKFGLAMGPVREQEAREAGERKKIKKGRTKLVDEDKEEDVKGKGKEKKLDKAAAVEDENEIVDVNETEDENESVGRSTPSKRGHGAKRGRGANRGRGRGRGRGKKQ